MCIHIMSPPPQVSILASCDQRPRGSLYLMACRHCRRSRSHRGKDIEGPVCPTPSGPLQTLLSLVADRNNIKAVEGLTLEELAHGVVCVVGFGCNPPCWAVVLRPLTMRRQ
jgi:hypothetical protein